MNAYRVFALVLLVVASVCMWNLIGWGHWFTWEYWLAHLIVISAACSGLFWERGS